MTNRLLQRKQMVKEHKKLSLIICLLVLGCKCSSAVISKVPLKPLEFLYELISSNVLVHAEGES